MRVGRVFRIDGQQLGDALRRAGLSLAHIRRAYLYLRRRPGGRLVSCPVAAGALVPRRVLRSVLMHAGVSDSELMDLLVG